MVVDNPYLLIGLSVLMHVAWNLMARHVDPRANYLWWALLAHLLLLGPFALSYLWVDPTWGLAVFGAAGVSAAAITLYFIALRQAYRHAAVALVYPLARSSPLLIVLWSWLWFDHTIGVAEAGAIALSVAGLWLLALTSRDGSARHALPWAGIAALATSVYSISDKFAVAYLNSFAAQLAFISISYATAFVGLTLAQRYETGRWTPAVRPRWRYIAVGGLSMGLAYALVVRAMREMPAAHAVSFTNAGIVLAVVLSITLFRERVHWRQRLAGAVVVSLGLVLLAWLS